MPSRNALTVRLSTGFRVSSLTIGTRDGVAVPTSCDQPVNCSATVLTVRDDAARIGGDDRVADAGQRDADIGRHAGARAGTARGLARGNDERARKQVGEEADERSPV